MSRCVYVRKSRTSSNLFFAGLMSTGFGNPDWVKFYVDKEIEEGCYPCLDKDVFCGTDRLDDVCEEYVCGEC